MTSMFLSFRNGLEKLAVIVVLHLPLFLRHDWTVCIELPRPFLIQSGENKSEEPAVAQTHHYQFSFPFFFFCPTLFKTRSNVRSQHLSCCPSLAFSKLSCGILFTTAHFDCKMQTLFEWNAEIKPFSPEPKNVFQCCSEPTQQSFDIVVPIIFKV